MSERQYGFRKGRNTIDAIDKVITRMQESKNRGRHILCLTLDISNAFNSARSSNIMGMARSKGASFLRDRTIETNGRQYGLVEGCPQGSSLGLSLWLLIMKDLFNRIADTEELIIQSFADDIIVMISDTSVKTIEET